MSERCCQRQLVLLSSHGAQWEQTLPWGHSTLNNMPIFIANWWQWQLTSLGTLYMEQYCVQVTCQGQVVILGSPGAQWVQTLPRGYSTVNKWTMWWYFMANWWYWVTLGHKRVDSSTGGIKRWTIWCPLVIIFSAIWWCWVPLGHNGSIFFPSRTQHWTKLYDRCIWWQYFKW